MNIRGNFEEKKPENGNSCYRSVSICLYFFQVPNIPFFIMMMNGGYGQNILRTLWGFSPHCPYFPSGGELLFHLGSSRGVKPKAQSTRVPAQIPTAFVTLETLLNVCKMGVTITAPTFKGCNED